MKITNNSNLPKTLVRAITNHEHKSNSLITVSQLLKSPRAFWLAVRHADELEQDVQNMIWALLGTASHTVAEMGEGKNTLTEEYFSNIQVGDFSISGTADLYEDGIVYDYKTVSVWTLMFLDDEKIAEFASQLNTYAYAFRKAGVNVKGLKIILIMRDWQASKAQFDANYPQSQIKMLDIPLFSEEETERYLKERVTYLMSFKDVPDNELPLCSLKYRWAKPSKWALMKDGRKSAIKLFDNQDDAESAMSSMADNKCYVEERKADEWKRCEYCSANKFCSQTQYVEKPLRENKELKCSMSFDKFMEIANG